MGSAHSEIYGILEELAMWFSREIPQETFKHIDGDSRGLEQQALAVLDGKYSLPRHQQQRCFLAVYWHFMDMGILNIDTTIPGVPSADPLPLGYSLRRPVSVEEIQQQIVPAAYARHEKYLTSR